MSHPWNNLSPNDFEQFCYHILRFGGFQDVQWLGGAGGDKGRDIVCTKAERVFRQRRVTRRWVVQCKHYKNKAPTKAEISEWLAACHEHRPDRVLLIVSRSVTANFRDWLQHIQREHPFEIHIWDETELTTEYRHHRHRLVSLFPSLPKVSRPVEFYTVEPCERTIYCNEYDEVGFVVMNSRSDADAESRVLEFVEFIKANDIKIWKRKRDDKKA